jgi:HAMP domain-containing protein
MSLLGAIAILLGAFGALMLRRAVVHPLAEITRVTEQVAEGNAVAIPYGPRRDEIGALSRSISVFQDAMRRNQELNKTVLQDAELRGAFLGLDDLRNLFAPLAGGHAFGEIIAVKSRVGIGADEFVLELHFSSLPGPFDLIQLMTSDPMVVLFCLQ